jgi:preprotein translocase subunit YajC
MTEVFGVLAAAAQEGGRGAGGDLTPFLLMIPAIIFLLWWMTRSQRKREQERKEMLSRLKKGDKVVTAGGIHGEIVRLSEHEAVLAVDKSRGVELRFQRSAISGVTGSKAPLEEGAASGN